MPSQVKNAHGTPYRFKEPLTVQFIYEQSYKRPDKFLLTPLALALDVISLPVALPTAGLALFRIFATQ